MTLHVVAVRVGDKYSRDYLAILHDSITRNLNREHRFWCVTDDEHQIHPDIGIIPANPDLPGWWQKLWLFSPDMPWESGDRIAYFDLDVAITGRLEELVDTPGIIRDWHQPEYNSSVMCWDAGDHADIWSNFIPQVMEQMHGDQTWITAVDSQGGMAMDGSTSPRSWQPFPRDWCLSFKAHAQEFPPPGCKVIVFHGRPDPHECDGWVKDVWKIGGYTQMTHGEGMNVSFAHVLENIRINSARQVPWFVGGKPHKDTIVIVGGAPSLAGSVEAIRAHRQRGAQILALNNAGAFLNLHGLIPDTLMVCDAREENVVFTRAEAKRYLIASQCDPSLFEALEGKDVHIVQLWVCDEMREVLAPYDATEPVILIGGGSTVGLRAISVAIVSGYRKVHCYGIDSSFADSTHHAYPQIMNDTDKALEVYVPALEKRYIVAPWMARQAGEFRDISWPTAQANEVKLMVHGKGLIPDMARMLARG